MMVWDGGDQGRTQGPSPWDLSSRSFAVISVILRHLHLYSMCGKDVCHTGGPSKPGSKHGRARMVLG